MTPILSLPVEMLSRMTDYLTSVGDLSALCRSGDRYIHDVVIGVLYKRVKTEPGVMCWACEQGEVGTVKRLLAAGADPNALWEQSMKRSTYFKLEMRGCRWLYRGRPTLVNQDVSDLYEAERDTIRAAKKELWDLDTRHKEPWEKKENPYAPGCDGESRHGDEGQDLSELDDSEEGEEGDEDDDMSVVKDYHWTPLHIASQWGHNDIVDLLLDRGANIEALSAGFCDCVFPHKWTQKKRPRQPLPRWTPLHTAICHGNDSTTRLLLSRGASVKVAGARNSLKQQPLREPPTALHSACASGFPSIARFLIENHQADVEVKDHAQHTPVSYAYFTGMWECIDLLVEYGASLDVRIGGWPLLQHACREERFAEALRLLDLGASPYVMFVPTVEENAVDSPDLKATALYWCAYRKGRHARVYANLHIALRGERQKHLRAEAVDTLIKHATQHNKEYHQDQWPTIMLHAAMSCRADMVACFLKAGVLAPFLRREHKLSALDMALSSRARRGSGCGELVETVDVILKHLPNKMTQREVLHAILTMFNSLTNQIDGYISVVGLLFEHNPSVNLASKTAEELVFWNRAAESNDWQKMRLCMLLLDHGLQRPAEKDLVLVVIRAMEWNLVSVLEYLGTLDGDILNRTLGQGYTPLHFVIEINKTDVVETLMLNGADAHRKATNLPEYAIPLHIAATTSPLEWAIITSTNRTNTDMVKNMLDKQPLIPKDTDCHIKANRVREKITPRLHIDYLRAVCKCPNMHVLEALLEHKLDFQLCDPNTGDSAIHMLCDALDRTAASARAFRAPGVRPYVSAFMAAHGLVFLVLSAGVNPDWANHAGVTGMDAVQKFIKYSGEDKLCEEMAETWKNMLTFDGGIISLR